MPSTLFRDDLARRHGLAGTGINRLAPILNQYKELELGPDQLSGLEMGYIYEECCGAFRNKAARRPENTSPRARSSDSWSNCWRYRSRTGIFPSTIPPAARAVCCPSPRNPGAPGLDRAATPEEKERVEKFVTVYNTGIFTYIWLLRNEKAASHRGRVMLIDARQQFEKAPKSFGNKRNRITDTHRQWIEQRYRDGWAKGYADEQVKIFRRDEKTLAAANVAKELAFHDRELTFRVRVKADGKAKTIELVLKPRDNASKKFKAALGDRPEILSVECSATARTTALSCELWLRKTSASRHSGARPPEQFHRIANRMNDRTHSATSNFWMRWL